MSKLDSSISPLDSRYAAKIKPIAKFFSESYLNKTRYEIELMWLIYITKKLPSHFGKLSQANEKKLLKLVNDFTKLDAKRAKTIEKKTNHDVKAIEYLIREKLNKHPSLKNFKKYIHFGLTSEDINSTSYAQIINNAKDEYLEKILELKKILKSKSSAWKASPFLSRTHGQAASPSTFGKEINVFLSRLDNEIKTLKSIQVKGKWGGATGNFHTLVLIDEKKNWINFIKGFFKFIKTPLNTLTTQIEPHDCIAELSHSIVRINNVLIDMNRDIWMYISNDLFKLKVIKGEVGSSTMPHKVNPIDFENSEGNLELSNALFTFFGDKLSKSRLQRDLSDSTVLRNIGVPFGHSYLAIQSLIKGFSKLEVNKEQSLKELNNNWQILGEAIQTVMKLEGYDDAYEIIKDLTRGELLTENSYKSLINSLEISIKSKTKLLKLTPATYIGLSKSI